MDLSFTPQEEAFRDQVRSFLAERLPPALSDKVAAGERLSKADMEQWHALLNARGWLANHWPEAFGGPGWSPVEKFIFELECGLANAPRIVPFGVNMLGPVLIKYGTPQQQDYWLPRILDGRHWWCQGYSEPGAGSDLAAVKTTAVRDGDHYVVNGQKTWTTLGQHANMIFCLVRTDREAKPQEGISFLLIDMASPGVEVRPIITLEGDHEINEVFFTDVRVPVANRVGEENKGWTCAKYLLTYERTNIAGVGLSMAALQRLKRVAAQRTRHGRPLLEDPQFAARLARVEIDLENMKTTNLRVIAAVAGGGAPGAESSMLKICGTQIRQELTALLRRAMGPAARVMAAQEQADALDLGPAFASSAAAQYFNNRKLSIFGGSNEIQKNIISKMILGL
ncbi:pimeloyl-CoA dehydrogenase large subunit [Pseudomonas sp. TKO26]|uniref:acyl-CoA dehydrogenase family protein n=1 Tax=unclassified Pseudomonas TaxID=196821 RepID=UPI000DA0DF9D|nr:MULTISPECIES: acyl-CoA dehydrogenase family protein [unclassified Pseudomonas]PYY85360.1 pimeloyl-CoA dehydrogenase large subunit [Pseudomonas sp. TKO30]PYY87543.1 pimeloyl-CoA dehydrogenase large subunit [Pseudomonas sp. TKO29]PYY90267.1 pimeloyl-CoA dehydrogenase large subunit [Pseudomonas sp. TKO26]PYY99452.1 pimeloyl-CoA dehydrogenase large subunit [Pseudomonas sp. TKO14]